MTPDNAPQSRCDHCGQYVCLDQYLEHTGRERVGIETKTSYSNPFTLARLEADQQTSEHKHRFEGLNPAQEGRVRKHLDSIDRAHDQGDLASARSHTAALRSYLDGLSVGVDGEDDADVEHRFLRAKALRLQSWVTAEQSA
jgi:hypothetical protein